MKYKVCDVNYQDAKIFDNFIEAAEFAQKLSEENNKRYHVLANYGYWQGIDIVFVNNPEVRKFYLHLVDLSLNGQHLEAKIEVAKRFFFITELEELEKIQQTKLTNGTITTEESERSCAIQKSMLLRISRMVEGDVYTAIYDALN